MAELSANLVRWGISPERAVSDRFDLADADAAYRLAAGESRGKVCLVNGAAR
jgi:hypothetical protein